MEPINLEAKARETVGSKDSKNLRREGMIPCELYGGKDNVHFYAPILDFRDIIYTDKLRIANIKVDGKEYKALIKEIQSHPVTDRILHLDFQELVSGKQVITEIPLKLTGMAEGVRDGGVLLQKLRKIKVKSLPENLEEQIEVDVSPLKLGKSINVGDWDWKGKEVLEQDSTPIARVTIPRAAKTAEEEELEAEEAAAAEGEGAPAAAADDAGGGE